MTIFSSEFYLVSFEFVLSTDAVLVHDSKLDATFNINAFYTADSFLSSFKYYCYRNKLKIRHGFILFPKQE